MNIDKKVRDNEQINPTIYNNSQITYLPTSYIYYVYVYIYIYIYIYQGSLQTLTIKPTIKQKQQIWKIIPETLNETRYRTQLRYNHLK